MSPVALLLSLVAVLGVVAEEPLPWWRTAVFYQIYPRSFKDSDDDGVGDIKGIASKGEYLKNLGVDAIWLSPIFKSPMADFGYDIADYRVPDKIFGTMKDLEDLIKEMKKFNIKILLDLVPNHTSDEHEWFQKSEAKIDPYTDYYIWHDGIVDANNVTKPPNNWQSVFSGPAWHWSENRKQFYLHQFVTKQPDLNYRNPKVVQDMDEIIHFWLDKGVDGFRVDAVPFLFEDAQLRDEPLLPGAEGLSFGSLDHVYTQNLPETYELTKHWGSIVANYTKKDGVPRALFLEAYANLSQTMEYYGHGDLACMQPFNFQLLTSGNQSTRAQHLKGLIHTWMDAMPKGASANWVIGNHDQGRIADRYGPALVDAMNLMTGVLPGVKVAYNGEEIGMTNTFIRWDQTVDPSGLLLGPDKYQLGSRDPERTPMQWDDSPSAGFSTNVTTWLPVNPEYYKLNVEQQKKDDMSHLKVFQDMAHARKDPVLQRGSLEVITPDDDTLLVVRKYNGVSFVLVVNMGSNIKEYSSKNVFEPNNIDADFTVNTTSVNSGVPKGLSFAKGTTMLKIRPRSALLLRSAGNSYPSVSMVA